MSTQNEDRITWRSLLQIFLLAGVFGWGFWVGVEKKASWPTSAKDVAEKVRPLSAAERVKIMQLLRKQLDDETAEAAKKFKEAEKASEEAASLIYGEMRLE